MIKQIGIIADDLTGANDSGVQLAKKGLVSTVVFDHRHYRQDTRAEVLIVDTDSRAKRSVDAYEAAYEAAQFLEEQGCRHIYKKLDSTLRGNVAEELRAVQKVFRPDLVLIAPAFPKMNRTTVQGHHYVQGVLITETEFAKDPKTPVMESYIPKLLQKEGEPEAVLISTSQTRQSAAQFLPWLQSKLSEGQTWFVCDSETEEDLQAIAGLFSQLDKKILWAGSAGLIEYLPEALSLTSLEEGSQDWAQADKALIVSGSLSQTTRRQLRAVEDMPDSLMLEIDPAALIRETYDTEDVLQQIAQDMDKRCLVLYVDASEENRRLAKEAGDERGLSPTEVSEAISLGLGRMTKAILQAYAEIQGLVLTGGDTAKAICMELGMGEMQLYSEVEPGLPFGRLQGMGKGYWTVTKAGGFGNDQSLADSLHYITNKKKVRI